MLVIAISNYFQEYWYIIFGALGGTIFWHLDLEETLYESSPFLRSPVLEDPGDR
jgi:hypothetical protein